ncbi:contact-dependent growth inhibition system immunity protein [Myceligenerans indicum]|uniref:Uncharacterized protein n=1 Tax=Myceligenerans indicum TaxID=2593663 RepID=A0ABS1LR16_9MICO|nr:contact-dependent growth inhibition system immunity protein [Myceligenerans indicum]MBL0888726.1 hypothetical protein [Myceligenerans indicum]
MVTLDDLDPPRWPDPPSDATGLMRRVHAARRRPLVELTSEDLRVLAAQQVALMRVLPLAAHLLIEDPFVSGDFYPGDLLLAAIKAPDHAWDRLSDMTLASRLATVLSALPETALADLPGDGPNLVARFTAVHG